ncbi:putative EF-hand calcium-binding domain-containing protein 6 [Apostichopus japonicus]|uniref:Putative EF-hand calcium-binding domain-containing protein 6 n=1 Tax=Stichopus japonicus TaxID=307972 RepID=A0A2G8LRI4_STIJA|nr:putative EF-hand calcium-binding domain-containing protein 6 [Apostichopus japonicus]
MAATAVQRPQSVGRPSNLPVIEHPMARLGSKRHLNVVGLNRAGLVSAGSMRTNQADDATNLPTLKEKMHSRTTTWPAEDNRRSSADAIIRRRIDPERRTILKVEGSSPREHSLVFSIICRFVAMEDVGRLLDWLGIDSSDGISFTKFISAFRDAETNSKRWVTPFVGKHGSLEAQVPFPEEHLRNRIHRREDEYVTASYANALLKEKCKHSDFDLSDHLNASCFEPDAHVLAPQLDKCMESLGVPLNDEEMDILWSRYDLQNTGAVEASWFFEHIGLDRFGNYLPRARTATASSTRSWSVPPGDQEQFEESKIADRQTPTLASRQGRGPTHNEPPRPPSTDIISSLMRKMEQGYYSLLMSCEHFDLNSNGMMTKSQLMGVLKEFGVPLFPFDMEQLLERCNLRRKDQYVSYKDFLYKYMIRSPQGIAHRVIMDPSHCFSNRLRTPAGNLSAEDAEAKLVEMLHKDFLKLLGTFQSLDPHSLHLITQFQFRESINNAFNMRVTDKQFQELLYDVGTTEDGLVPYPGFLAIFNKKRYLPTNLYNNQRPQSEGDRISPTPPSPPPPPPQKSQSPVIPSASQRLFDHVTGRPDSILERKQDLMEGRFKPVHQIASLVQDQLRYNRLAAKEAFERLDAKKTGRLSRTQLHYWLQALGFVLHPTELQNLWKALKTGKDGLVHQGELLDFFTRDERISFLLIFSINKGPQTMWCDPKKSQAVMKKSKSTYNNLPDYHNGLQRSKVTKVKPEPQVLRDSLGSPNLDILGKIRPQVVKHWDELKSILRNLDPDGYGYITVPEFKNISHFMKFTLTEDQLLKLALQFDFDQNRQFHYLQFMQMFAPSSSPVDKTTTNNRYNKNTHKIVYQSSKGAAVEESVGTVLLRIKKQLMKEWKNLRRAFKQADLDKNGYLSVVEFKTCIRKIIKDIKEDDLFYVLSELDSNMDGQISYDEFLLHFQDK